MPLRLLLPCLRILEADRDADLALRMNFKVDLGDNSHIDVVPVAKELTDWSIVGTWDITELLIPIIDRNCVWVELVVALMPDAKAIPDLEFLGDKRSIPIREACDIEIHKVLRALG